MADLQKTARDDRRDKFAAAALGALLGEGLRAQTVGAWRPKTRDDLAALAGNAFEMAEVMLAESDRRRGL